MKSMSWLSLKMFQVVLNVNSDRNLWWRCSLAWFDLETRRLLSVCFECAPLIPHDYYTELKDYFFPTNPLTLSRKDYPFIILLLVDRIKRYSSGGSLSLPSQLIWIFLSSFLSSIASSEKRIVRSILEVQDQTKVSKRDRSTRQGMNERRGTNICFFFISSSFIFIIISFPREIKIRDAEYGQTLFILWWNQDEFLSPFHWLETFIFFISRVSFLVSFTWLTLRNSNDQRLKQLISLKDEWISKPFPRPSFLVLNERQTEDSKLSLENQVSRTFVVSICLKRERERERDLETLRFLNRYKVE